MQSKTSEIRVLFASSEQSADVLYLSGVFVPDPFLSLVGPEGSIGVVNRLEYGRVKQLSRYDQVLELDDTRLHAARALKLDVAEVGPAELIRYFAKCYKARQVRVPADFPAGIFQRVWESGLKISASADAFFPEREFKTDTEARALRAGNAASAAGIRAAEAVLRASRIEGKRLVYESATLTSERLRCLIDQACLEKGAVAQHTIVAGGKQACDPHEGGHGPLRPAELIIIDVFPRVQATGYHGDMTRTFLKGKANAAQTALVGAVRAAQEAALAKVKAGVAGGTVHEAVNAVFLERGYPTERRGDSYVGFFHSTGHGLGLEVHEQPRVSPGSPRLRKGQVITIEPGLYYPEVGGCRIEDVVRVTKEGAEKLSSMHYRWQIR
ncbi:M24 family metallopeptidase [Coraliomargarita parva]|uniref:M24 family metallopeptidase n=1 Tax=Coraliomargarita parva TaxID=3014050 RepID=UPI0022B594BD|nr:M24 family metallopeptidase [Coraliomargarita parva]